MNNNKYFEFNISPKNEPLQRFLNRLLFVLKIVVIIITAIIAYFAFMISNPLWFLAGFTATIAVVLHLIQLRFYNFFDLIYVDGFLSVVKVYGNVRRKTLIRFDCKSIAKIGFAGGETYYQYIKDKQVKKIYTNDSVTSNDIVLFVDDNEKRLIFIPYDERFLSNIIKMNGISKLDKSLIEKIKNS